MTEVSPAHLAGFQAGSLLAGYRLDTQVGAGGMALVFRAQDERLKRLVALKILDPVRASDAAFRQRFINESLAAAAVDDPHIIPVYEAGEADGVLYIAMRFVPGGDLGRVLEREGRLPPDRVAGFISPVASALDAAHAAGLVHRDVKPGNILVDARRGRPDHVYLSDFGISKITSSVTLTGVGNFIGTVDYSAPEQLDGRAVDGRADQYSLGCVTYQLLTGAVPFERDHTMAVAIAHMSAPPPSLTALRPDLPPAADQVLTKAMAKTPDQRYASCGEFADALREALGLPSYNARGSVAGPAEPPPPAVPSSAASSATVLSPAPNAVGDAAAPPGQTAPPPDQAAAPADHPATEVNQTPTPVAYRSTETIAGGPVGGPADIAELPEAVQVPRQDRAGYEADDESAPQAPDVTPAADVADSQQAADLEKVDERADQPGEPVSPADEAGSVAQITDSITDAAQAPDAATDAPDTPAAGQPVLPDPGIRDDAAPAATINWVRGGEPDDAADAAAASLDTAEAAAADGQQATDLETAGETGRAADETAEATDAVAAAADATDAAALEDDRPGLAVGGSQSAIDQETADERAGQPGEPARPGGRTGQSGRDHGLDHGCGASLGRAGDSRDGPARAAGSGRSRRCGTRGDHQLGARRRAGRRRGRDRGKPRHGRGSRG